MRYDFKTLNPRSGRGSYKWDMMKEENPNVSKETVPLSVADMEFQTSPEIKKGLQDYIETAILGYTGPYKEFYDSVISWFDRRHDYKIEKEWIVNTPGVVNALFAAVNAWTDEDDGVIVFKPVYPPFVEAIEVNNRRFIDCPLVETDGYWEIDFKLFEELAKEKSNKLLMFCSPQNPVGRVWTKDELRRIGKICLENNIKIISDEIWSDIIMPGYEHTVLSTVSKEIEDITAICTAPSKTFNIAGLEISNIIIKNDKMREKYKIELDKMRSSSVNILGYKACEIAYNESEEWLNELLKVINKNQNIVNKFFNEKYENIKSPLIEGTYVQWVDFRSLGMSYMELQEFMYQEAEFFTNQGWTFGKEGEGFIRINLAVPTNILKGELEKLEKALEKYKN